MRRRFRRRKQLLALAQQSSSYLLLSLGAVLILIPFFWMVSTSLKEWGSLFIYPPQWIPRPVVWRNYADALTMVPFFTFLKNTCVITFTSLFGQVLSASLVAFSFARLRWPGRDVVFIILLSTLMLPYEVTLIPKFILFRTLRWIDTFKPLIVPDYFGGG
ncbi:MAG: carbohydrate ABC transporter permease, partial [Bacillota bacterium]